MEEFNKNLELLFQKIHPTEMERVGILLAQLILQYSDKVLLEKLNAEINKYIKQKCK